MKKFNIYVEICLGYHCCGCGEYAEGTGSVELEDSQVDQLVALIKENNFETDVERLRLEEKYPEIYQALDEAYSEAASEASYRHWLIEGYEGGYFDQPDDLMQKLEEAGLFKYEPESGDDEAEVDEDEVEYAKDEAFCEWLDEYFESLDEDEQVSFIETYYDVDYDGDADYDYTVEIPQEIVEIASDTK